MKKICVFMLSVGLMAAAVQAADQATSVNAVGFVNVTLPASNKYIMVSANFDALTNSSARTLTEIFGNSSGLRQNTNPNKVDRVYLWDVPSQQYVVYGQKPDGLFYLISAFSVPTNPVVPQGYGFSIKSPTAANGGSNDTVITLSGQVPVALTNSVAISGATPTAPYQFMANPFPVASSIDSLINTNHGAVGSNNPNNCDRVYLWDVSAQQYVVLGLKTPTNRWFFISAWTTNNMPAFTIEPGVGFVYRGKANFTWNAEKPYLWP